MNNWIKMCLLSTTILSLSASSLEDCGIDLSDGEVGTNHSTSTAGTPPLLRRFHKAFHGDPRHNEAAASDDDTSPAHTSAKAAAGSFASEEINKVDSYNNSLQDSLATNSSGGYDEDSRR